MRPALNRVDRILARRLQRDQLSTLLAEVELVAWPDVEALAQRLWNGDLALLRNPGLHSYFFSTTSYLRNSTTCHGWYVNAPARIAMVIQRCARDIWRSASCA